MSKATKDLRSPLRKKRCQGGAIEPFWGTSMVYGSLMVRNESGPENAGATWLWVNTWVNTSRFR